MDSRDDRGRREKSRRDSSDLKRHSRRRSSSSSSDSSSSSYSSYSSDSSSSSSRDKKRREKHKHKTHRRESKSRDEKKNSKKRKRPSSVARIEADDFFRKNAEYREWLWEQKGLVFSDLTADQARLIFGNEFVPAWNGGDLNVKYYTGNVGGAAETAGSRTHHKWNINGVDSNQIAMVKKDVDASTNFGGDRGAQAAARRAVPDFDFADDPVVNEKRREQKVDLDSIGKRNDYPFVEDWEEKETKRRHEEKKYSKRRREDIDELVPKETGRDALRDKKRFANQARREAQEDKGGEETIEPFDDGRDPIKARIMRQELAREKAQQRRQEQISEKVSEFSKKEAEKLNELRALARQSGYNV